MTANATRMVTMHPPTKISAFRNALTAFESRFEGELASLWGDLEGKACRAIVRVQPAEKLSVLSRFFEDAAKAISGIVHEYFPKLLHVAASQRRYLGNVPPLMWTQAQMLVQVCDFLGLDRTFDETSQPRADSQVSAAAARIAIGVQWLDEEIPNDFVLPGWANPEWHQREILSPADWRMTNAESLPPLSRAETLQWIKKQEFWINRKLGKQIEMDSQDATIVAGGQIGGAPLAEQGASASHRQRGSIDGRKELIASLKARHPGALARKICGFIDQEIYRTPSRRAALALLDSWQRQAPDKRSWVEVYDHPKTHNRVRAYVNKVPPLRTAPKVSK